MVETAIQQRPQFDVDENEDGQDVEDDEELDAEQTLTEQGKRIQELAEQAPSDFEESSSDDSDDDEDDDDEDDDEDSDESQSDSDDDGSGRGVKRGRAGVHDTDASRKRVKLEAKAPITDDDIRSAMAQSPSGSMAFTALIQRFKSRLTDKKQFIATLRRLCNYDKATKVFSLKQ
jgi:hypothetical protein